MKRVGYTTGVFDMFHIGHLNLLRRAKLECDYLIVGVTTDELCQKAKNKTPIIPLIERLKIVQSIKFVDEVVPQTNYDKHQALRDLKFNVMFVGDDWKGSDRWNQLELDFKKMGCDIVYFPYSRDTSSSTLRAMISSKLMEAV
ncbi:adenylyltransferase/cytidyltransferase family protein [Enterovibrio baiacu]|uniref:adenylyltransferase/cytidyltransferase family protein n=1 Tax=Enterovibrio baiacu TaxID=2491023 RepID=UPI003D0FCF76